MDQKFRLRQREKIFLILRLELDGSLQMFLRERQVVPLHQFEKSQQMMARTEVWHQSQGLLKFSANLHGGLISNLRVGVPGLSRQTKLFFGINEMRQKTHRSTLHGVIEILYRLSRLV